MNSQTVFQKSPIAKFAPLDPLRTEFCRDRTCEQVLMMSLRNALPAFGDWCVVELCNGPDRLRTPWIFSTQGEDRRFPKQDVMELNHLWDSIEGTYSACRDGSFLHHIARSPEHLKDLASLGVKSYATVPIYSLEHVWGWLTFFSIDQDLTDGSLPRIQALASCLAAGLEASARTHQVERRYDAKNKFISMVSHELRAPLNITLGWSALLLDDPELDPEIRKTIEIIYRNTRAQADIITNLFDATRIDLGKLTLDLKDVHLGTFIEQQLSGLAVLARDKGVHLKCKILAPFARMMADPLRLHQILQNLVTNAIKFTPPDGEVLVSLQEESGCIILKVKDSGEGIPSDFIPQVFDRFKQRTNLSSYQPGLGLGLSIVKELVLAHGGEVTAESDGLGRGSTFTIQFFKRFAVETGADPVIH